MSVVKLNIKPSIDSRAASVGLLQNRGDCVVVMRGTPRWLLLKCPCGCGEEIPVNVDPRAGKAWRLYEVSSGKPTLYPSVWRDTGCRSHFILWRGQIYLFGRDEELDRDERQRVDLNRISARVLESLRQKRKAHFADIADSIEEIPWDVLDACRFLVRSGQLVESAGIQRGTFAISNAKQS